MDHLKICTPLNLRLLFTKMTANGEKPIQTQGECLWITVAGALDLALPCAGRHTRARAQQRTGTESGSPDMILLRETKLIIQKCGV